MSDDLIKTLIRAPRQIFSGWDQSPHPDGRPRLQPRGDAERAKTLATKLSPREDPCSDR